MAADGAIADLSRLRQIAEEGRQRPLLGGPSLIVWGGAIATAALFHWMVVTQVLPLPRWSLTVGWFGLMAGAALVAGWLQHRYTFGSAGGDSMRSSAALSNANRVSRSVWRMTGAFLGTLSVGLVVNAILAARAGLDAWPLLSVIAPVTFGVFGIALAATAVAGEADWLRRYAWGSLGLTVVTAALLGQPAQYLVFAAGAVGVGVLPGLRLLRAQ